MERALKVVVSSAGVPTANGQPVTLGELAPMLAALTAAGGVLWYHRENPADEPHENAMKVIQLVAENKLSIRLFEKPDFTDNPEEMTFAAPPPPLKEKSSRASKNPLK